MNSISSNPAEFGVNSHAEETFHHQQKTLEAEPWIRLDFSRAKWYSLMYRHGAPKPIKFGRSARWVPAEVDAWVERALKKVSAT
jgi:predicted DNA-binding transcriptional regulator AlpA